MVYQQLNDDVQFQRGLHDAVVAIYQELFPGCQVRHLEGQDKPDHPLDRYDRFPWTRFYEAMADRLLTFRDRRDELIGEIHAIAAELDLQDYLKDHSGPLRDICPFTVLGLFNRKAGGGNKHKEITRERREIARELANLLGVSVAVPDSFEGIPCYPWWFFDFESNRQVDDIDALWGVFAQALAFARADGADPRSYFIVAFDNAMRRRFVGWNLTIGLFWVRPWHFPALDTQPRSYIIENLKIQICKSGKSIRKKQYHSASDYLEVLDALATQFQEATYPVHSFPELVLEAFATVK